ncbi:hypothetical protein DL546_006684 [Coniochaeta pulveracea]|uniref:Uncharacterized protein n=1 Tax=Coniochaeta pulveracea TaxID=177199 RepID=A0A420YBL7_9PEZI|nr:hypothetical protein DL546_006684 [Coniochaeta pulveracea]
MVAPAIAASGLAAQRILPAVVVVGAVSAVATYVKSQLQTESKTMDRYFAQYKDPRSEASRQRVFEGQQQLDPRRSVFNILGW